MEPTIELHPDLVEELNQIAELLGVPVTKCLNEAVARWLQKDAQGYLQSMLQPERPALELVK